MDNESPTLIRGLVTTRRARSPNFKVLMVSAACAVALEIVRKMTVFALPESECCSKRVSLESR